MIIIPIKAPEMAKMVVLFDLLFDMDFNKGTPSIQLAVQMFSGPKLLTIPATYSTVKVKHLVEFWLNDTNLELTAMPASKHELHRRNPVRSSSQVESRVVVGPALSTQSDNVTIPAQFDGLATNSLAVVRQSENGCRTATEEMWDWKSERQEMEDCRFGRRKVEVFLRWSARPMPMRLRRVWQQFWVAVVVVVQAEVSHGKVLT